MTTRSVAPLGWYLTANGIGGQGIVKVFGKPGARETDALGERSLLVAMIEQALLDMRIGSRHAARDALRWINDTSKGTYFTFEGACELLELNANKLRRCALSKFKGESNGFQGGRGAAN